MTGDMVIVDTNVARTASNINDPSPACVLGCVKAIQRAMQDGIAIDTAWEILSEYKNNLGNVGGISAAFLTWVLTNQTNPSRVVQVKITPGTNDKTEFAELPKTLHIVDRSDRKFVAVAIAHPKHPTILQAVDSKWWGWRDALQAEAVTVEYVCKTEIAEKYQQKMGP